MLIKRIDNENQKIIIGKSISSIKRSIKKGVREWSNKRGIK